MSYNIEKRYVTTNSMTVAQAQGYYGAKYVVTDYFTHWWGDPASRASTPDAIYDYMVRANKSVRHILGYDDKQKKVRIIAMTPEDRVPLTQQGGNIYGDSVEVDPIITIGSDPRSAELYKALGWLMWQREQRWGRALRPRLHKDVWPTACSNIDKARVQSERNKWVNGTYGKDSGMKFKDAGNARRILISEVLGRDRKLAHADKWTEAFTKQLGDRDYAEVAQIFWSSQEGKNFRDHKDKVEAFYQNGSKQLSEANALIVDLRKQVEALKQNPSKEQFEEMARALTEAENKTIELQQQIEEARVKDEEAENAVIGFLKAVWRIVTRKEG